VLTSQRQGKSISRVCLSDCIRSAGNDGSIAWSICACTWLGIYGKRIFSLKSAL